MGRGRARAVKAEEGSDDACCLLLNNNCERNEREEEVEPIKHTGITAEL